MNISQMDYDDRQEIFADAFNLFLGEKIGSGQFRDVFDFRFDDSLVIKVETSGSHRSHHNVLENHFWNHFRDYKAVSRWLAPCISLSPDGLVLVQKKVQPLRLSELPAKLPTFLTDCAARNYGWFEDRIVCCDYGFHILDASIKLRNVNWADLDDGN